MFYPSRQILKVKVHSTGLLVKISAMNCNMLFTIGIQYQLFQGQKTMTKTNLISILYDS